MSSHKHEHHSHNHDQTSAHACAHYMPANATPVYRKILWVALVVNLAMFGIEIAAGSRAGSVSLLADALDFFGDAFNYGVSLFVLGLSVARRAKASILKAVCMFAFGLLIFGKTLWNFRFGVPPEAVTMGAIGLLALAANVFVALLLYAYREGDSNMRSVWICSRNDAIGNVAVILAALGVFGTHSALPDLIVAALMATLALRGAWVIWRLAELELQSLDR